MIPERPAPKRRSRRSAIAWLILAAALVSALLAAWAVQRLSAYADARRKTQLVLVEIAEHAGQVRLDVERATERGSVPQGAVAHVETLSKELRGELAALGRLDPGGDAFEAVNEAVADLLLDALEQLRLTNAGNAEEARAWSRDRMFPAFDVLLEAISDARLYYGAQADRARRQAVLGSAAAIGTEAALIGLLAFLFERGRRSEQLLLAEERARGELRFRAMVQNSFDVVALLGPDARVRYVSPSIRRVLAIDPAEWHERTAFDLVHPDDVARAENHLGKILARPSEHVADELRVRHTDGSWRWIELTATNLLADASLRGIVMNFRDVTERRQLHEQLRHQALHDPLTGLANRALFRNLVEHALAGSARRRVPSAVLYLDLDGFKQVNDRLGHAAGDQLLVEVAQRLRACLRGEDTAARLGGDEFAALLDWADETAALRVAERILVSLRQPVTIRFEEVLVGGCLGVAVSTPETEAADELIRQADLAMYFAKEQGKGRVVVFEPAMQAKVRRKLELESDLRRAIEREEFTLAYQPILNLASGSIAGVEALLRWRDPDRAAAILPGEFIPLAEETGLMVPLGRWVLKTACHQVRLWQDAFPSEPPLVLSVNLTAKQFWDPQLIEDVDGTLAASGLPASCLSLEIAEPVLMHDVEQTLERLLALKRLGIRLAIDDFGGGQSALRHLRRFPIDAIKIDRLFVDSLVTGTRDAELTQGIIELAHKLQLQTVAEGIEGDAQRETLDRMGCELGQGFSLAIPMEPLAVEGMLRGGPPETARPWPVPAPAAAASGGAP